MMTTLTGRCHCGNLSLRLETRHAPEELPVWTCDCSFCRLHGARTTSDPEGRVSIRVQDPAQLSRYRFGLATADFLVCRRCGVYVAAMIPADHKDGACANLNITALDAADRFTRSPVVAYPGESAAERLSSRRSNWTPVAALVEG
ncbi:MAG TPA: aldehyde-activating protein [Thermoanaerobaculia bacterium]|nr:aldehyde-activating protein [Thermoanaerobaculia bacterium]